MARMLSVSLSLLLVRALFYGQDARAQAVLNPNQIVRRTEERGIAMLLAVLLLMMVSLLGIVAIEHAGDENSVTGRTRDSARTFYAADAGTQLIVTNLGQEPTVQSPFTVNFASGTFVRSGGRSDPGPQPIEKTGVGEPPEGYALNLGAGFATEVFLGTVTAFSPGGSSVELESKYWKMRANASY
jgi:hypothetical protein